MGEMVDLDWAASASAISTSCCVVMGRCSSNSSLVSSESETDCDRDLLCADTSEVEPDDDAAKSDAKSPAAIVGGCQGRQGGWDARVQPGSEAPSR